MVSWQQNDAYYSAKKFYNENDGLAVGTARYGQIHNPWAQFGVNLGLSIFDKVICHYAEGGGGGSSSVQYTEEDIEDIKTDIKTILDKYDITDNSGTKTSDFESIDDLEALYELKQNEYQTTTKDLETKVANDKQKLRDEQSSFHDIKIQLGVVSTRKNTLSTSLEQYKKQLESLSNPTANVPPYNYTFMSLDTSGEINNQAQIDNLEGLIAETQREYDQAVADERRLDEEKRNKENEIITLQDTLRVNEAKLTELKSLKQDIDALKSLISQLKKAEGKDAIEGLTNNETDNIANLIRDLRKEQTKNPNSDKAKKIKEQLEEALRKYVNNSSNNNLTFINYAASLGIEKNS